MSVRGSVATMPVEDVLEWAVRRRVTGVITAERGGDFLAVAIGGGAALWASSSRPDEQLGRILLASGNVDPRALDDALSVREETRVPLGHILLMVGAVDENTLVMTLATKIRETVAELVTWTEGSFELVPQPVVVHGADAAVGLETCLGIARRRAARWAHIRGVVPGDDARFFAPAGASAPPAGDAAMDTARLWAMAIAGSPAAHIAASFGGERFTVLEQLAMWVAAGALAVERRQRTRAGTPGELADGADARLRQGDRIGALDIARRALAAAPGDPAIVDAHARAERSRVAELARTMLARHRVPRLVRSPAEIAALELSDVERRLVHRIDGRWDLLSLVRTAAVGKAEALLALARLAERGVVELS